MTIQTPINADPLYAELVTVAEKDGAASMLTVLAESLRKRKRWHALFDLRLMQARLAFGLSLVGDTTQLLPEMRQRLDERSLEACREVGWPLLEEGHVAAGWIYLRAAVEPAEIQEKLRLLAARVRQQALDAPNADALLTDEKTAETVQEMINLALWEGVDPALGLSLLLEKNGTCNAITAYEQAVSRLPATAQKPAASVIIDHLYHEVREALAADLGDRGHVELGTDSAVGHSLAQLLKVGTGLADDQSTRALYVDVSHLQSVLRIARVCTDPKAIQNAWELACYACCLPAEVVYPGEPPFENVGVASRYFFGAQLGHDREQALAFFRRAAATARLEESGTLPADTLVLLLWRLGRPAEALHAALQRPCDDAMPSTLQATVSLPSLVELAHAGQAWQMLREACCARGDEITFAATLADEMK